MNISRLPVFIIPILLCVSLCFQAQAQTQEKKVLFIDSYHEGYGWSDGITDGVKSILDTENIELRIHRMDTKRNQDINFLKQSALKAKNIIEEYKPDVVIATDDNASKYLIVPYYKDSNIPFVFAGLNWSSEQYGYPFSNVTGMIEVSDVDELINLILEMSDGKKIGMLSSDTITEHKENNNVSVILGIEYTEDSYVSTVENWKKSFVDMQKLVDIIILGNVIGIPGWDNKEMENFVLENTSIPSGTVYGHMAPYVMVGYAKKPEEQGVWAASMALKILSGASPSDIPITTNKEGKLYLNVSIAKKLGVDIPLEILELAEIIEISD